jgi:hypothetical protein
MSNFTKIMSNLFTKENEKEPSPVYKPKGKELTLNTQEESNMKTFNENTRIHFDFKVYGRSIFQNLILTATASNQDKELIPIKCKWRRVKNDIVINIKEITSNSYLPTAEDIGYIIEVEVIPIDNIYGTIPSLGQYGPIMLGNDMKNTLEILLTSGGTKFSCHLYDISENQKVNDKEIRLYINTHELKLVEVDYNGKEKILEETKYHHMNPVITPHHNDIYRFTMKFYSFEVDGGGSLATVNNIKQIDKSVYHLVAMSKQCRELIYLLIQFFLLDEKIKNSKLFTSMNYNLLPQETKVGVTDLISEIKTLREENSIILNNMKILDNKNKDLVKEMKCLEEDFQVTLETINCHMNNNLYDPNGKTTPVEVKMPQNNSLYDLKKKYDDLITQHSLLSSKEKSLREENRELLTNCEINKNKNDQLVEENKSNKQKLAEYEVELYNLKKSFTLLAEQKNKFDKEITHLRDDHNILKQDNEELKSKLKKQETAEIYNKKIKDLEAQIESITYENKNLIVQRNVLNNQKEIIQKELNKLNQSKDSYDKIIINLQQEKQSLDSQLEEKNTKITSLSNKIESHKKELNDFKFKHELLESEHNSLKQNFDSLFKDNTNTESCIKITAEEYDEYDQLKREKDETDAILMQLKSNNDAKDLEIRNLKAQLEKLKI